MPKVTQAVKEKKIWQRYQRRYKVQKLSKEETRMQSKIVMQANTFSFHHFPKEGALSEQRSTA